MPAPLYKIDDKLFQFCTVRQMELLQAVNTHKGMRPAARALGVNFSTVEQAVASVKAKAALQGYSPEHQQTRVVPPGQALRGVSALFRRGEVEPVVEWVKTKVDDQARLKVLEDFARWLVLDVKPIPAAPGPTGLIEADLLSVYPMGDPHFGMYAWWQDAGDNFDLDIAERLTTGAIDRLVAAGPASGTALLLNLGDMFHADNQNNTSKSGHQLDVDGRWKKVQQVGLRAMVHAVRRLLDKHPRVIVKINGGNHDGHSSYALALMLDCYFAAEPRVEIDLGPAPVWYMQFGNVLLGSTHGDTIKGPDMPEIMAADQPKQWGDTSHRHWYVGHVHHQDLKEYRGCTVEYFRTLAARDAWHSGQGYRAGRDMRLIVHHREFGEIERHRCDVAMLSSEQNQPADHNKHAA